MAKELATIPSDKDPNGNLIIKIEGEKRKLTIGEDLILRRAFYGCKEVHLLPMLDGLSGVLVYRAYATLLSGSHLQYFVKLGDRNEIFTEYFNYAEHVRDFIPFHLGPHLASDRCCLGADKGIIVGDFVNESESLHDCARDGRATHAIASLFNQTLSGWYIRSRKDSRSIGTLLAHLFPKTDIPPKRRALANKLGATKSLLDLLAVIKDFKSIHVLIGPTHGDLHAKNVLVRTTEAIVIDFLKYSEDNPLVYDAACLEVGLLIDGFSKDGRRINAMTKSIEPLYNCGNLHIAPKCDHPKSKSYWFYNAVHQIRIHARQMECEDNQYAAALVVALLRRACKDTEFSPKEENRRASAYFLAELVILNTFRLAP